MNKYEEQYYHDIHRIANALEKIAKNLENPLSNQEHQIVSGHINSDIKLSITCPYCNSKNIQYMYGTTLMSTNENQLSCHYICNDCQKEFDV